MASWAALNVEAPRAALEDARDIATEEAQDARNALLYEKALRLQHAQKNDEAKTTYTELLEVSPGLSPRLRYLCAKNLATLEAEQHAYDLALRHFSEALALDATDVLVWYQLGKAALATEQLWLARQAFESGFQVDKTFWPLVYSLCDVLHAVGDDAAYNHVAQYLVEHDPSAADGFGPLRDMDNAVDPAYQVLKQPSLRSTAQSQSQSQSQSSMKRPSKAMEASCTAAKKRKVLVDASRHDEQLQADRAPLTYLLQKNSWLSLGKLLLEAYEDVTSERNATEGSNLSSLRRVRVVVDFTDEPESAPLPVQIKESGDITEHVVSSSPAKEAPAVIDLVADDTVDPLEKCSSNVSGAADQPIEVDQGDDDGGGEQDVGDLRQALRRKSRRHEEKLREEHEIAAKQAREKNLAFRLQAFVPPITGDETIGNRCQQVVFRMRQGAVVLELADGTELHVFEDVFPCVAVQENSNDPANTGQDEPGVDGGDPQVLTKHEIATFVEENMGDAKGSDILSLLRRYLNQCGVWADRKFHSVAGDNAETSHPIVLWTEKVVRGTLDHVQQRLTSAQSRVSLYQSASNGFTYETRMLLLELRLDELLRKHPEQGPGRPRKLTRTVSNHLDDLRHDAQRLLFDLCVSEDSHVENESSRRLLARLFWLCGQMCERGGDTNGARDYLSKCKQELETGPDENAPEIHLANLHNPVEISIATVDQKIESLQFAGVQADTTDDKATEVEFSDAQTRLLTHFFPANSEHSRIEEFLTDFAAFKRRGHGDSSNGGDAPESSLLELLLETVDESSRAPCSKKILILLVVLHELLTFLDNCRTKRLAAKTKRDDTQRQDKHTDMLVIAIQAIELTVDRLASTIISGSADSPSPICPWTSRATVMGLAKLFEPSTLLLFESPRDVFLVICDVENELCGVNRETPCDEEQHKLREWLLLATFSSFHAIRSLPAPEFQRLSDLLPVVGGSKSKRKQTTRRDRARQFVESSLAYMARHAHVLVSQVLSQSDMRALMEDCCPLLKEEEETIGHRHESDKIARKIAATGSVLFLHLFVATTSRRGDSSLNALVALVELLHERLGQHDLCAVRCHESGGKDSSGSSDDSFVAAAVNYLSDRRSDYERTERAQLRPVASALGTETGSAKEADAGKAANEEEGDATTGGEGFDATLAQCFRCLYDVHVLSGCADHKAGATISNLENAPRAKAIQLARFAIPMMLKQSPRNNAQKKENLKILFAIRRAVDVDTTDTADTAVVHHQPPPVEPSTPIIQYTTPQGLLSWEGDIPQVTRPSGTSPGEAECLENLWFLLGENFILLRVRRRSNLSELIEMERRIKERVAFLIKDVHYYRPSRIRSWMRLGRVMKELYQVTSDACSLVLGQKRAKEALLACARMHDGDEQGARSECVLHTSLFEKMKEWQAVEDPVLKAEFRVQLSTEADADNESNGGDQRTTTEYRIEELAVLFMFQTVEFARRCFDMAAALATAQAGRKESDGDTSMEERTGDKDEGSEAALMDTAVECYEESGLLLYNQLQEFATLRHRKDIATASDVFPLAFYGKILRAARHYFEEGARISTTTNPDAHDVRFRLQYMLGKVLKKQRWLERELAAGGGVQAQSTVEVLASNELEAARSIMMCFATAEEEHEKGKMEKSIVHAFYQLQAMRLELIISESVDVEKLTLACDHYFEEAVDGDDDDDDNGSEDDVEEEGKETDKGDDTAQTMKVRKEDVAAILSLARLGGDNGNSDGDYLQLARAWLFYNVIDALDSISDEDRYFHPSRYAIARAMYHYHDVVARLSAMDKSARPESIAATSPVACIAVLEEKKHKKKNDGTSSAETALKEMHPLFDKRRPQVVAIWLSEHVPPSKKFEELNQRQIKFDLCRLKYWKYYVQLLQESEAYARLKEIGAWVVACKEEHDAIAELLGIVFHARGVVQLTRLKDFVCSELVDQLQRYHAQHGHDDAERTTNTADRDGCTDVAVDLTKEKVPSEVTENPCEMLLKELAKYYINYVDVAEARGRLVDVLPDALLHETVLLAEFPIVCLFLVGATEFPNTFQVLERDDVVTASRVAEITPKFRAMLLNDDLSLQAIETVDWKPLLDAARLFCEDRWPERVNGKPGTSKPPRKSRPSKAAAAPTSTVSTTVTPVSAPAPATLPATVEDPSTAVVVDLSAMAEEQPLAHQPPPAKSLMPAEI